MASTNNDSGVERSAAVDLRSGTESGSLDQASASARRWALSRRCGASERWPEDIYASIDSSVYLEFWAQQSRGFLYADVADVIQEVPEIRFIALAKVAAALCSILPSNAAVERSFSQARGIAMNSLRSTRMTDR